MSDGMIIPPNPFGNDNEIRQKAAVEIIRRQKARSNLIDFAQFTFPGYIAEPFHQLVAQKLDAVVNGHIRRLMIFAPPQHGKELAHSTQIPTPQGFRNHGDLLPGDYVFGRDGKPVKVFAISEEGVCDQEVEFSDHSVIKCHRKHEWVVFDYLFSNRKEKIYETQQMKNWGVRSGPRKRGFGSYFKVDYNVPIHYEAKELPIHPYVLGAWLGDGCSKEGSIYYDPKDYQVAEKFISLGYSKTKDVVHTITGVVKSKFQRLHDELRNMGLLGNKEIPSDYLHCSIEQRLELLAGLIDTDGAICPRSGRSGVTNTNPKIIEGVEELVRSLGWRISKYSCPPQLSSSGIQGKKDVYYTGFNPTMVIPVALPRKKHNKINPSPRKRSIVDIRDCKPEPSRCIQVEGGVYLVGKTFIPTHNSELTSVRFPAYWLGRRSDDPIILCSYGASLAESKSRQARQVVESSEYNILFGGLGTRKDSRAISEWQINGGRGYLIAAGVSGAITGKGAMLGLIDDPLKDWEEAQSETIRDKCWDWYRTTFLTRIWEQGAIVLIQTRWHEDDLAGRILRNESSQWEVIRFPAIAEDQFERDENNKFLGLPTGEADPLGRDKGEPLCPRKFSKNFLESTRRSVGPSGFSALYQGVPRPSEGNRFKRDWFLPATTVPYNARRVRAWDKAATHNEGDYTVGALLAYHDGIYYIEDVVRGRWLAGDRDKKMKEVAERDAIRYKNTVSIWVEQEPGSGGKESAQNSVRLLAGYPVYIEKVTGSKEIRSEPFASQAAFYNVRMVPASWNNEFLSEFLSFPSGLHDDIVDAVCMAFNKLAGVGGVAPTIRVYGLKGSGGPAWMPNVKKKNLKIAVCSKEELEDLALDDDCLLISIDDPDSVSTIPPHRCQKLLGSLQLQFADLDPNAEECSNWEAKLPPWDKSPEEVIMSKEQGKKMWAFLLKKRGATPSVFIIQDRDGFDRRAISMAMGISEILNLAKEKTVYLVRNPEGKCEGKAPNQHVFQICKSTRHLVI